MAAKPFSILLLADNRGETAATIRDHADAFGYFSRHDVYRYDPIDRRGSQYLDFNEFDVVVIHYSIRIIYDTYLHGRFKERLAKYQGLKIQFIQDDYRNVNAYMKVMRDIGIHLLFTLCPASRSALLWPADRLPGVKLFTTLAGYVPDYLVNAHAPPMEDRSLDVGYRSRAVPFWLGKLGQEKTTIVQRFLEEAPGHGLKYDVSSREEDRLYGPRWTSFIRSCRAMLGTESGASIADFDGSLEAGVNAFLRQHPQAGFDEVHAALLQPHEGNVLVNCISPRAFETAALRTALVLFPGEYSGILRPWDHYIPLAKDFANFTEVVQRMRDIDFLRDLTRHAYRDLIESDRYSYRAFAREFDAIVDAHAAHVASESKANYGRAVAEMPTLPQEMERLARSSLRGLKRSLVALSASVGKLKKTA
jgi:hypothetical protein